MAVTGRGRRHSRAAEQDAIDARLVALEQAIDGLEGRLIAALEQAIDGLEGRVIAALEERDRVAADRLDVLRERIEAAVANAGGLAQAPADPDAVELELLAHVAPLIADRHAFDIGAHRGRYTDALLDAGFEVAAAEPNPELATLLRERLADRAGASVHGVALDNAPGRALLRVAEHRDPAAGGDDPTLFSTLLDREAAGSIGFRPGPEVETTTVDALRRELGWPADVGFMKIDVEGAEDRVLAGRGETRATLVMTEFWGASHMLAPEGRDPAEIVVPPALREGDLRHWIALIHDTARVRFAVNAETVPPASWGNVLFFACDDVFQSAVAWCRANLDEWSESAPAEPPAPTAGGHEPWRESEYHEDCLALDRLRRNGWRPRCVFDVGASNGAWSSVVATVFPLAEFHLFEPLAAHPNYAPNLEWLASRSDVNITVHPIAVDDAERETTIGLSTNPVGSSVLVDDLSEYFPDMLSVTTKSLDAYRSERSLPSPQLLKIDTQGLELRILQGAEATLQDVEVLLLETWVRRGYGAETPLLHEVMSWLAQRGFVAIDFAGEYRDGDELFAKDIVFARPEAIASGA